MNKRILLGTVSALALLMAAESAARAQVTQTTTTTNNTVTNVFAGAFDNVIDTFAFDQFKGALQVQQNASINSSVSQNMAIDALNSNNVFLSNFSTATSTNTVSGNKATNAVAEPVNSIAGSAFGAAAGTVQVQQNASVNGSTGQSLDIDPVVDTAGLSLGDSAGATLSSTVNGNGIVKGTAEGFNFIAQGAFQNAKGVFEVQQNASINSSTQQNLSLATIALAGGTAGPLPTAEADLTQTVGGNSAGFIGTFSCCNTPGATADGLNFIDGNAFESAQGAFQVQQSSSANSAVGQNMAIATVDSSAGAGSADNAVMTSTVDGSGNFAQGSSPATLVDTQNEIGGAAFDSAQGAFQVQQNGSVNSAVGQNMAVSAVKETGATTDAAIGVSATSTNTVNNDIANPTSTVNANTATGTFDNQIDTLAFGAAMGTFQVEQNRSINSSTGQNMKVTAVTDPNGTVHSAVNTKAALTSNVGSGGFNFITEDLGSSGEVPAVAGKNIITDGFQNAQGTFQVQQSNGENSSTQQNMAIAAITATGGSVASLATTTEADLTHNVSGSATEPNIALDGVQGANTIDGATLGAFQNAHGAFQVQQSSSGNSAVGQNMAIASVDAETTGTPKVGSTGPDAALSTTTVSDNAAGMSFGISGFPVNVDVTSAIDDFAFENAQGAFQVQQNASVNSSVGQNMAITAIKESGVPTDPTVAATATSTDTLTGNSADSVSISGGSNTVDGLAFGAAIGAFQVQQNQSVNGSTGQNMRIIAVTDPAALFSSGVDSTGTLGNTVGGSTTGAGNSVSNSLVNNADTINTGAFQSATGAFQVQQNNSINSSTQQNMAIAAIDAAGAAIGGFSTDEAANLSDVVTGNTATGVTVIASNSLSGNAFQNAQGAFQVQQNTSANSAVSQNISVVSVNIHH